MIVFVINIGIATATTATTAAASTTTTTKFCCHLMIVVVINIDIGRYCQMFRKYK